MNIKLTIPLTQLQVETEIVRVRTELKRIDDERHQAVLLLETIQSYCNHSNVNRHYDGWECLICGKRE